MIMTACHKNLNSFMSFLFPWNILHIIKLAKSIIGVMAVSVDFVFLSVLTL
jgi:hypothetical protein